MPKEFQFSIEQILQTQRLLGGVALVTPILVSHQFPSVLFKAENLQVTGSFKIRPAFAQVARLTDEARLKGIVTSSSGNFAQAAAYAAARFGISAKIVMMESASALKKDKTRAFGGIVVTCPDFFEAREETVARIASEDHRTVIHPYNHADAILGNATLGVEIAEQHQAVRNVVVPISGGGLIAGILSSLMQLRPGVRVWGVQPEGSSATYLSHRKGERVSIPGAQTIADGLRVTCPGSVTFPIIHQHVEDVVTVSEESIIRATRELLLGEKLLVEPSGAVTLAALLEGKVPADETVCVLSGGNIAPQGLLQILNPDS